MRPLHLSYTEGSLKNTVSTPTYAARVERSALRLRGAR